MTMRLMMTAAISSDGEYWNPRLGCKFLASNLVVVVNGDDGDGSRDGGGDGNDDGGGDDNDDGYDRNDDGYDGNRQSRYLSIVLNLKGKNQKN